MTGSMTAFRETRTYTGNRLAPFLFHVIAAEQESQRALLTPDEAMRLPEDAAFYFRLGNAAYPRPKATVLRGRNLQCSRPDSIVGAFR